MRQRPSRALCLVFCPCECASASADVEKGLAPHPGTHTQTLNQREEQVHPGHDAVFRRDMVVLDFEAPQRLHTTSVLAIPIAQGGVSLVVWLDWMVFCAQRVLFCGAIREVMHEGLDNEPC